MTEMFCNQHAIERHPLAHGKAGIIRLGAHYIPAAIVNRVAVILAAILLLVAGCENAPVAIPEIDPEASVDLILAAADKDSNKILYQDEWQQVPSLAAAAPMMDTDGDGMLTRPELLSRMQFYKNDRMALLDFTCTVLLDGRPLEGATVTLIPEPFMGPEVKPCSGITAQDGWCYMRQEGSAIPGSHCGMFRVSVSKKEAGVETIPAKYNTDTILSQEVATDIPRLERGVTIELSSETAED